MFRNSTQKKFGCPEGLFLEVVVQTTTYIQFAFVVLHSRGGSWELVDAFSLCCLTWHFWKILGE